MSRRPTDCDSKPTPEPSVLDAGTESAAVSLTLTAATENNTASRPSAGRDRPGVPVLRDTVDPALARSEEHTSELQSRQYLVCRLLLEKKQTSLSARSSP